MLTSGHLGRILDEPAFLTLFNILEHEAYRRSDVYILLSDREDFVTMDRRLLIDFSQVYGQNGTREIPRSVYNTYSTNTKALGLSFEDMLTDSLKNVNSLQLDAEKKIRDLAIGDVDDISEVVLATSRADTALRLVMELRNKFLDAYQALSRITG